MFFNKKNESLYVPCNGEVIDLEQVNDPVFSQKMMGDGFAVIPENGEIYAPISGIVNNIFPTKHALGIKTEHGVEVLIHMGINTVELNGLGFTVTVSEGQKVDQNTNVAQIDLKLLEERGYSSDIMIIVTNMERLKQFTLNETGVFEKGKLIASAIIK